MNKTLTNSDFNLTYLLKFNFTKEKLKRKTKTLLLYPFILLTIKALFSF
jgi:hypothetical protein